MSIKELFESAKNSYKPVSSIITRGQHSKLIGISLGKGIVLKEHKAPGPTKLILVKGGIEYRSTTTKKTITELEEFNIPLDEIHSVLGLEDSVFLLSVNL